MLNEIGKLLGTIVSLLWQIFKLVGQIGLWALGAREVWSLIQ